MDTDRLHSNSKLLEWFNTMTSEVLNAWVIQQGVTNDIFTEFHIQWKLPLLYYKKQHNFPHTTTARHVKNSIVIW